MPRPAISAAAFVLTAGNVGDTRDLIHVDPEPGPRGRRLLAAVEPLEPTVRGFELASFVLTSLRAAVVAESAHPPGLALTRAFALVNAALLAETRPAYGGRRRREALIGVSAGILSGRELTIAQVPPTQAIVAQDRRLCALPALASWRPDYLAETDDPEPAPLGSQERSAPILCRTDLAPGDIVVLCSSTLARSLGRDDAAIAHLHAATTSRGDRAARMHATLDCFGLLAALHQLEDAHATAITIGRLPARIDSGQLLRDGRDRATAVFGGWSRRPTRAPMAPSAWPIVRPSYATATATATATVQVSSGVGISEPRPPAPGRWHDLGQPLASPRFGPRGLFTPRPRLDQRGAPAAALLATTAVTVTRGLLGPLGAAAVHRYTGRGGATAEWKSNLPRGLQIRLPGRMMAISSLALVAFSGSGVVYDQHLTRQVRVEHAFAAVDGALETLAADPADAHRALAEADVALAAARRAGAPVSQLAFRQEALDGERDLAWGVRRLVAWERLGTLPAEANGTPGRLVRAGDRILLVAGALYEVDAGQRRLVRLLGPGDWVGNGPVGPLGLATGEGGAIVAADATATYARDEGGFWLRRPLISQSGAHLLADRPAAAAGEDIFALGADGSILRVSAVTAFAASGATAASVRAGSASEVWVDVAAAPDLRTARDLAIGGGVHVLLGDGRVRTFEHGEATGSFIPDLSPPLVEAVAISRDADSNFFYVLDSGSTIGFSQGRILRVATDGSVVQFVPPPPSATDPATADGATLATAHDLVVDEATGTVYVLTDRELWRGTLPTAQ